MGISLQHPVLQAAIQQGLLARMFLDPLLPKFMWRAEATGTPESWPGHAGETLTFTINGLLRPSTKPLTPGMEPPLVAYQREQYSVTVNQYAPGAIDTPMKSSAVALLDLLREDVKKLGIQMGDSLNRVPRNILFNAGLYGWSVVDGAVVASTSVRLKRLNGFTRARRPDLLNGSQVNWETVSPNNPLKVFFAGSTTVHEVIGFTPDIAGDEIGPGVITLRVATSLNDRDAAVAEPATFLWRVGFGNTLAGKIDLVTPLNQLRFADLRSIVAHLGKQQVPKHATGYFHGHFDPQALAQLFGDPEFQRMATGAAVVGDEFIFRQQVMNVASGVIFLEDPTCPFPDTVLDSDPNQSENQGTYTQDDNFGGELWNNGGPTGQAVRHGIIMGADFLKEYQLDQGMLLSDAGVTGFVADYDNLENGGVRISTNGVRLVMKAATNRLADIVSCATSFIGGWGTRPDSLTGSKARYKRCVVVQSGA